MLYETADKVQVKNYDNLIETRFKQHFTLNINFKRIVGIFFLS